MRRSDHEAPTTVELRDLPTIHLDSAHTGESLDDGARSAASFVQADAHDVRRTPGSRVLCRNIMIHVPTRSHPLAKMMMPPIALGTQPSTSRQ